VDGLLLELDVLGISSLELEVGDGLSLDMVLAGDRRRGVAWSTRPSRSASRDDGGAGALTGG
jgi:hypothetical protein